MKVVEGGFLRRRWLLKTDSSREDEIRKILKEFRERTNISCSNVFTEDGFLIAVEQAPSDMGEDGHQAIGALCATIDSLAQNGVEILKGTGKINQFTIQAGDQLDEDGFLIILDHVSKDIILSIIFPSFLNLGVILFELNQTVHKLKKYFESTALANNLGGVKSLQ